MESIGDATVGSHAPDIIAVVERNGAAALQLQHGAHVGGDRVKGAVDVLVRMGHAQSGRFFGGVTYWNVAVEWVVRAGLIGQQVGDNAAAHQFGKHCCAIADQYHR